MAKGILEKSMDLLARRPLTAFELRSKLTDTAHYSSEEVEEAVSYCRQRGYLNDSLLASDAVQFLNAGGRGRGIIRKKLRARGVEEETVAEALEQLAPEDEEMAARSAAEGKLRLLTREKEMRKKREKLFRFLISRGFSPEIAGKTVRSFSDPGADEPFSEI